MVLPAGGAGGPRETHRDQSRKLMGIKLRLQEGKIRLEEVTVTAPFSLTLYRDHNSKVITHLKIDFKLLSLFYNKHIVVLSPEKKKMVIKKI